MKPPRCKPKETSVESGDFWHKLYQMASMIIFHEAFNPPSHILFIVCIQNRNNMYSIYTYILYVYICVYIMCVCNNIYIYNMYIIFIYIQYIMLHLQTDTGKWHVQGLSNKTWMSSCKALWKHLEDKKVKWSSQLSQFSSKHTILHMHCVVSLSCSAPESWCNDITLQFMFGLQHLQSIRLILSDSKHVHSKSSIWFRVSQNLNSTRAEQIQEQKG